MGGVDIKGEICHKREKQQQQQHQQKPCSSLTIWNIVQNSLISNIQCPVKLSSLLSVDGSHIRHYIIFYSAGLLSGKDIILAVSW